MRVLKTLKGFHHVGIRVCWAIGGDRMTNLRRRTWVMTSAVATLMVLTGLLYAWNERKGCFSYSNYQRIQNGVSREQVAELLGSPGEETKSIPGFPPYVRLPGAP